MEARNQRAPAAPDRKSGKFDKRGRTPGTGSNREGTYVPKPTAESQTLAGRASKLLGRFGAAKLAGKAPGLNSKKRRDRRDRFVNRGGEPASGGETGKIKAPEQFVFEGRRASAKDGKPKDLKFKKGKTKAKSPNKKGKGGKVGKY
jgi:nucleolar protein 12